MIVARTFLLLIVAVAGAQMASANECNSAYQSMLEVNGAGAVKELLAGIKSESAKDLSALRYFLVARGVESKIERTNQGYEVLVIIPIGDHPLSRLAQFYEADGVRVAFAPYHLKSEKKLGAYLPEDQLVILDSRLEQKVKGRLSITDLHELLHARIDLAGPNSYLGMKFENLRDIYPDMVNYRYGSEMSVSEILTTAQDIRLLSGKLRKLLTEGAAPAKPNRYDLFSRFLTYFFRKSGVQEKVKMIETATSLMQELSARVQRLKTMINALHRVSFSREVGITEALTGSTMPINGALDATKDERVTFTLYGKLDKPNAKKASQVITKFRLSESSDDWSKIQSALLSQMDSLRVAVKDAQPVIEEIDARKDALNDVWKNIGGLENASTETIFDALTTFHELTKKLHLRFYRDYSGSRYQQH